MTFQQSSAFQYLEHCAFVIRYSALHPREGLHLPYSCQHRDIIFRMLLFWILLASTDDKRECLLVRWSYSDVSSESFFSILLNLLETSTFSSILWYTYAQSVTFHATFLPDLLDCLGHKNITIPPYLHISVHLLMWRQQAQILTTMTRDWGRSESCSPVMEVCWEMFEIINMHLFVWSHGAACFKWTSHKNLTGCEVTLPQCMRSRYLFSYMCSEKPYYQLNERFVDSKHGRNAYLNKKNRSVATCEYFVVRYGYA